MIRGWLKGDPEDVDVSLDAVEGLYLSEKESEIKDFEDKQERLETELAEQFNQLKGRLEFLNGYSDDEGRQRFDDVAVNIQEKTENIDGVDGKSSEEVKNFLSDLSLDRKEKAVLEHMGKKGKNIVNSIKKVDYKASQIQEHNLDSPKKKLSQIKELKNSVEQLQRQKKELEEEKSNIDLVSVRERLEDVEGELDAFYRGDKWQKKQSLEEDIQAKEDEIEGERNDVSSTVSSVQRALKKLEYESKGGLANFAEYVKNEKWGKISDIEEMTDKAQDKVKDICSDKQIERFQSKASEIKEIPGKLSHIRELEKEKEQLQQELDGLDLSKEKRLKKKIRNLEQELEERMEKKERLDSEQKEIEIEIDDGVGQIEEILNEELYDEYSITRGSNF